MKIIVEFDDEILLRDWSRRAEVGFVIFFLNDGRAYPGAGWNDFGARLLGFWMTQLRDVICHSKDVFELVFLDGDFSLQGKLSHKTNSVSLVPKKSEELFVWECPLGIVVSSVISAAYLVISRFEKLSIRPDDIASLREGIRALEDVSPL